MKCETAVSVFVLDTLRYLFMYKGSNKLAYYNNDRSLSASAWRVCMYDYEYEEITVVPVT